MAINQSATVDNPTIAANGTSGYAVGDILEILDGASTETFPTTHPTTRANYEVTAVTSGQVDSVRLRNAGVYTALPTDNGTTDEFDTTILSGAGVGTVSLGGVLFATNGWTIERETSLVGTVTINAAGTGYSTGPTTLVDGGDEVVAAGFTIDTVGGSGEILTFTLDTGGVYHKLPATLNVVGGNGDGIMNVTVYTAITDRTIERELIMSSMTGNTIVGFRTFTNGTYHTIELSGLPAYVAANTFLSQPQISPGHFGDGGDDTGCFLFLRDTDPSLWNWFLNITERRMIMVCNIDTGIYNQAYLGLGNPFATSAEYALPMFVGGGCSRVNFTISSNAAGWAGPPFAVAEASTDDVGPCQVHSPGGAWVNVRAGYRSTNDILPYDVISGGAQVNGAAILPPGGLVWDPDESAIPDQDVLIRLTGSTANAVDLAWDRFAGVPTVVGSGADQPDNTIRPAPGDDPVLWETIVAGHVPTRTIYMELDDFKWVERTVEGDVFSAEDEVTETSGEVWIVFNSGNLTTRQHWFAMKLSP